MTAKTPRHQEELRLRARQRAIGNSFPVDGFDCLRRKRLEKLGALVSWWFKKPMNKVKDHE